MTTEEFINSLKILDLQKEPFRVFEIDSFEPDKFTALIGASNDFVIEPSSDGLVSQVFEDRYAAAQDNSRTSRYFCLHTDGQYLPRIPLMALLYCVDPGTANIPTVFADSQEMVRALSEINLLDTAKEFDFIYIKKEGKEYRRPLIEKHLITGEDAMCVVTVSAPIRLVPRVGSTKTLRDAEVFYNELSELAQRVLTLTPHYWQSNQMVVFDNVRLLHGRDLSNRASAKDDKRHLIRIWLNIS